VLFQKFLYVCEWNTLKKCSKQLMENLMYTNMATTQSWEESCAANASTKMENPIAQLPRPRTSTLKKKRRCREERERKVPRKGVKSMRGQPEMYDELKKIVTVSLTPTAVAGLDQYARDRSISRSELVERIGRQVIKLVSDLVHE
jgi:hypothetical protein